MITEWTCQICKAKRPDAFIDVYKTDISEESGLPKGTMQQNVKYCNDNSDCIEKAKTYKYVKGNK